MGNDEKLRSPKKYHKKPRWCNKVVIEREGQITNIESGNVLSHANYCENEFHNREDQSDNLQFIVVRMGYMILNKVGD
jgi:hypothetical protein